MATKPKKPEKPKKAFITIKGKEYAIPSMYSFGEAESIYDISGMTLDTFLRHLMSGEIHPKALVALMYVLLNRGADGEVVTLDEIRAINLDEFGFVEKEDDSDPPSEAAAGPQAQKTV